jgi:DNA-binding GntR family transcriptional regulator
MNEEMTDSGNPRKAPKLARTVLRQQISKIVIERILDGTYPPGSRIVESQLAKEFGTSQAPAREALRDLEGMNLIETRPHKGARVRELDPERLKQIYPVRAALEELAGRVAASRVTDELIEDLESELEDLREAARRGDASRQMIHDTRFHEIIVESTGNEVLLEMWRSLKVQSGTLVSVVRGDWDLHMIAEQHVPIIHALKSRDPNLVASQMRSHIEFFGAMVLDESKSDDS